MVRLKNMSLVEPKYDDYSREKCCWSTTFTCEYASAEGEDS